MSLAVNALATFAEAKAMFGYQDDEQTKVEDLINIASAGMDAFCRRALKARDCTLLLDGTGTSVLIVPEYPLNSISKLKVDESRAFGVDSEIASTLYSIKSEEGLVRLFSGCFSYSGAPAVVKLEGNAGYATTHLSYPVLRGACLEYTDWLKSRFSTAGSIGKKGEYSADRVSVSFETEMPMHIRAALGAFVREGA